MEVIEVFGLSRSGHHAVINWIIKNLCGVESEMKWKLDLLNGRGVIYINEANLDNDVTFKYIEEHKNEIKYLVLSYENTNTDFTILNSKNIFYSPTCIDIPLFENVKKVHRIVVIRDFYNNLASRIVANEKNKVKLRDGTIFQWEIDEKFINKWKEHARAYISLKNRHIKFETWLNNKKKRKKFLFKNFQIDELYDNNVGGTHSSFTDSDYMNRFDGLKISDDIKKIILEDSELHYLMGKIGYQYKKI